MKTKNNSNQQKQKENQLVFIEYEKPTKDGHFVTVMDSYRNVIGRVHKSFNEQTKKFEFTSFDHAGKTFSKSEKLWELKNEFINNREQLLEQAHQRRVESKEKAKEMLNEKSQKVQPPDKSNERKNEIEKLRHGTKERAKENEKAINKAHEENKNDVNEEQNQEDERKQELDDLRNDRDDDDRGDIIMNR